MWGEEFKMAIYLSGLQKVLLPSISRIINLPKERILWHLGIMLHAGPRLVLVGQMCKLAPMLINLFDLDLINSNPTKDRSTGMMKLGRFLALLALLSSFVELLFLVSLTIVGERESGTVHVYFFVAFMLFFCIQQISSGLSGRLSKTYNQNRQVV